MTTRTNTRNTRRALPGDALHRAIMALGAALDACQGAIEEGDAATDADAACANRTVERAIARLKDVASTLREQERASTWDE